MIIINNKFRWYKMSSNEPIWFPEEILKLIALKLPMETVGPYCEACKLAANRDLWFEKIFHDFDVTEQAIAENDEGESPQELYIKIAAYSDHLVPGVEKYLRCKRDICRMIYKAAKLGNRIMASKLLGVILQDNSDPSTSNIAFVLINIGSMLSGKEILAPPDSHLYNMAVIQQYQQYLLRILRENINEAPVDNKSECISQILETSHNQGIKYLSLIEKILTNCDSYNASEDIEAIVPVAQIAAILGHEEKIISMKNNMIDLLHTAQVSTLYQIQSIISRYANQKIMDILQNTITENHLSLPIGDNVIITTINSGNLYTITSLMDLYRKTVDAFTFESTINMAINLADERNDPRMRKKLLHYAKSQ